MNKIDKIRKEKESSPEKKGEKRANRPFSLSLSLSLSPLLCL
jgi:hypothetical protein